MQSKVRRKVLYGMEKILNILPGLAPFAALREITTTTITKKIN